MGEAGSPIPALGVPMGGRPHAASWRKTLPNTEQAGRLPKKTQELPFLIGGQASGQGGVRGRTQSEILVHCGF